MESMKKKLAIYLVLLSALSAVSCGNEQVEVVETPYAMINSFKLGSIRSTYPAFTSDGRDTTLRKTISMSSVPFHIDQAAGKIYNSDSLLFATDVSKVTISMSADGVPAIYDDSTELYNNISSGDSIDFTRSRKVRVYSVGGACYKDYEISVNVHQVEPELMVWTKSHTPDGVEPVRALEWDGEMCLFGKDATGNAVVARTMLNDTVWSVGAVTGLPVEALSGIQKFNGRMYAVAGGNVYSSQDAAVWETVAAATGAVAIVGASDEDSRLWVAGEQGMLCSTDGVSFENSGELPEGFPLYGVSITSSPLSHNKNIIRYTLVGYPTAAMEGNASVWCRLSNENRWTCYDSKNNPYPCPDLKNLAVFCYDGYLYALGGSGTVDGVAEEAFASFFISKDNGVSWKKNGSFYQRLPKDVAGVDRNFAATVDSRNFMWIIAGDPNGGVWKGIINRLGFNE